MSERLRITGQTHCLPLVGHPVEQVHTPPTINRWFDRHDLDVIMFPVDVLPAEVDGFFSALRGWDNCKGCSVTVPHKQAAMAAMDFASERARRLGAVNIVRRDPGGHLVGEMTDGLALVRALSGAGIDLRGSCALVVGAGGGAGAAIVDALCCAGVTRLRLLEPDVTRRRAVLAMVAAYYPSVIIDDTASQDPVDLAINASPMGMGKGDPLPFDPGIVQSEGAVVEIVTKPAVTRLLAVASARGMAVLSGAQMANAQVEFQLRHLGLWHVPTDDMPCLGL